MSSYVEKILMPGEEIQFFGKVHPVVYWPGTCYLVLAILSAKLLYNSSMESYFLYSLVVSYPSLSFLPHVITGVLFVLGIYKLMKAFFIACFTELVATNFRVIAKFGVYETTTIEMEKHKIAGVVVHQSIWGKTFNYGTITLRGFAGNISGLPVITKPYEFQKYVTARGPMF